MLGWALAGVPLFPSSHPELCASDKVSLDKGSVFPKAGCLFLGQSTPAQHGISQGSQGRRVLVFESGFSEMQPHISLFPVNQICFKSCDETELQNPLYEHPN